MGNYNITLACRNYDRTQAILRGLVKVEGIKLKVLEMSSVPEMFSGFFRGEYDVSEFSLAELVYHISRGNDEFVGIPVFPSRVFRHGFVFCAVSSDIQGPEFLQGKRIGFPRLVQTASIWIRGILIGEYKNPPKAMHWYAASLHHWDGGDDRGDIQPRDGSIIHWLERKGRGENEVAELALSEGRIDVLGTTQFPKVFSRGDKEIKRLFPNYQDVEAAYFKKTRILPIMHVLAARKAVVDRHPDLPEKIFELFSKAKRWGREWIRMDPSLSLVWKNHYLDEEDKIFGGDPWAYGLKENAHAISQFLSYCYDLGVSKRELNSQDLFAPSTWDLAEKS